MKITATIITLNEEQNIDACIRSVQRVCHEVIVVDSGSRDATREKAEALGARVFVQEYLGDGPQKHRAAQFANHDWILSIDADERLDEDAVAAIRTLDLSRTDVDGYGFKRKSFVGRHWIKAAGFYPDSVVRLYHRKRAAYRPEKAHSRVAAGRVEALDAHLIHFTYRDYTHWVERINALSTRDAWAMYERGVRPSPWAPALHALAAVIRKYLLKGGVFQGLDGATVTITTAFHAYMKYLKLIELHEQKVNR